MVLHIIKIMNHLETSVGHWPKKESTKCYATRHAKTNRLRKLSDALYVLQVLDLLRLFSILK